MAISLYDVTVGTFLQITGGVEGFLERGAAHFADNGIDPEAIVETRLWSDMLPFRFQVMSVVHHSIDAIAGAKAGLFSPSGEHPPYTYAELQGLVRDARAALEKLTPDEVNGLAGRDVTFAFREFKLPFTAENFLLSFSLPNFYFHATTAYDILRSKGVPLGKRDFTGKLKIKR